MTRRFALALAILASAWVFLPAFEALYLRWMEPVSYFDHAILVPFVCLWMAWRERTGNAPRPSHPNGSCSVGFGLSFLGLALQLVGAAQEVTALQGAGLVLFVWGSVLIFGGRAALKRYRWPLLYLLLLIPIPSFLMAQLTLGMRELSTSLAAGALQAATLAAGLPFSRVGNTLHFAGHRVTVVDACSGMNTLITVVAIGLILVYLERSRLRAWVTAALLIPAAILANLIRLLLICALVAAGQSEFAFGAGHSSIGVLTVGLALLTLAFGVRLPARWEKKWEARPGASPSAPGLPSNAPGREPRPLRTLLGYAGTVAGFALLSILISGFQKGSTPSSRIVASERLPKFDQVDWVTAELPMDEATYRIVGTRDAHMFQSSRRQEKPVYFYWLHSQDSRKIGHPPDLCYRGDGFEIVDRAPRELQVNGRTVPAIRMLVQRGDYRLLVYYWYRLGGVETASYLGYQLQWLSSHFRKIAYAVSDTEGVMNRVSTEVEGNFGDPRAVQAAELRLAGWLNAHDSLRAVRALKQ